MICGADQRGVAFPGVLPLGLLVGCALRAIGHGWQDGPEGEYSGSMIDAQTTRWFRVVLESVEWELVACASPPPPPGARLYTFGAALPPVRAAAVRAAGPRGGRGLGDPAPTAPAPPGLTPRPLAVPGIPQPRWSGSALCVFSPGANPLPVRLPCRAPRHRQSPHPRCETRHAVPPEP